MWFMRISIIAYPDTLGVDLTSLFTGKKIKTDPKKQIDIINTTQKVTVENSKIELTFLNLILKDGFLGFRKSVINIETKIQAILNIMKKQQKTESLISIGKEICRLIEDEKKKDILDISPSLLLGIYAHEMLESTRKGKFNSDMINRMKEIKSDIDDLLKLKNEQTSVYQSNGGIVAFNTNKRNSFVYAQKFVTEYLQYRQNQNLIIIGFKDEEREITTEEGESFANTVGIPYIEMLNNEKPVINKIIRDLIINFISSVTRPHEPSIDLTSPKREKKKEKSKECLTIIKNHSKELLDLLGSLEEHPENTPLFILCNQISSFSTALLKQYNIMRMTIVPIMHLCVQRMTKIVNIDSFSSEIINQIDVIKSNLEELSKRISAEFKPDYPK
ncbi:MAG: hypothetical protein ACFFB5_12740 [Promethearchaeota archaeon]